MKDYETTMIKLTITSDATKLNQLGQLHIRTSEGLLKRIDFEMNPGDQIVRVVVPVEFCDSRMIFSVGSSKKD